MHTTTGRLVNGDWTGLNFAYVVITETRLKKLKATIIDSSKAEHNIVNC